MPQATAKVGSQNRGVVFLRMMLQGISKSTYPMKYIVRPVRYSFPAALRQRVIVHLYLRASRTHVDVFEKALDARITDFLVKTRPMCVSSFGEKNLPLDRSKKDSR